MSLKTALQYLPDTKRSPVRTRSRAQGRPTKKLSEVEFPLESNVPVPLKSEARDGIFLGKPVEQLKMQELRKACDFLESICGKEPVKPRPRKKSDLAAVVIRLLEEWAEEEKDDFSGDSTFGRIAGDYEDRHGRNWGESSEEEPSSVHNYNFTGPDEDGQRILYVPVASTLPTQVHLTTTISTVTNNESSNALLTSGFDMSRFAPPKGHWKCNACLVYNPPSITRCQACETNRE